MVVIFSGPIRSHKTTLLMQWVATREDCGGVLSPDHAELRMLYNIKERALIPWQKSIADAPSDETIGRFVFDRQAFNEAVSWLEEALKNPEIQYVVLDEVGPLEISGKGWDAWIKKAIPSLGVKTLIMVVRETLVERVIAHYGIADYAVVERDYFRG